MLFNGRYSFRESLGDGTHGSVCLVSDILDPGRLLTLKEVHGGVFPAEEATCLAQLCHKAIPRLHEVFRDQGRWYLAMDYIDGETLRAFCEREGGRLPLDLVREIGVQLCSVLDYLHEQGLVYLDLTPINVLRAWKGQVSLVDFSTATGDGTTDHAGSRRYAAPEQNLPGKVDARADLYSLGVILHELLTGSVTPLEPGTPVAGLENSECVVALRTLCFRMVEINREKRPQSALEVMRALLRI